MMTDAMMARLILTHSDGCFRLGRALWIAPKLVERFRFENNRTALYLRRELSGRSKRRPQEGGRL